MMCLTSFYVIIRDKSLLAKVSMALMAYGSNDSYQRRIKLYLR